MDDLQGMRTVAGCCIDDVENFETFMIDNGLNQRDEINEHCLEEKLVGKLYCRRLIIPKGVFLTGRVHKKPYLDIFISGDVTVKSFCHDGEIESTTRLNSFEFLNGKPGRKRVLFAHEETIWLTIDPVEVEDVTKAEDDMSTPSLNDFNEVMKCLQSG